MQSFCKSQFPHKFINLFFTLVMMKDKLTDLCRILLLTIDCINTFCEMKRCYSGRGDFFARLLESIDRNSTTPRTTRKP